MHKKIMTSRRMCIRSPVSFCFPKSRLIFSRLYYGSEKVLVFLKHLFNGFFFLISREDFDDFSSGEAFSGRSQKNRERAFRRTASHCRDHGSLYDSVYLSPHYSRRPHSNGIGLRTVSNKVSISEINPLHLLKESSKWLFCEFLSILAPHSLLKKKLFGRYLMD